MNTKKMYRVKGFTLVEMLVVIAIIGILSAILIPSITGYVKKAKIAAAVADAKVIKTAVEASLMERFMVGDIEAGNAFNKVLSLEANTNKKKWSDSEHEIVGAFTNYSWVDFKTDAAASSGSQTVDRVIAGTLDDAFTEKWAVGKKVNPMRYNTSTNNCAKYLQENNTNFGLIVVYNQDGGVRMMQLYRKGILVTYLNGEFIPNASSDAHFVGEGTWNTIYEDAGKTAPEEYCKVLLMGGQIKSDGTMGGWFT